MNSPNLEPTRIGALDALFDDIEHALRDLTTATLDDEDGLPALSIDEFATDFLIECSRPPDPDGNEVS